jgi:putative transposon-encoded protein
MNEQIKELAEQAFDKANDGSISDIKIPKEFVGKFAELIVRECASQVRFTDLLKCNDDSDGEILLQASVQLKQHFGVE